MAGSCCNPNPTIDAHNASSPRYRKILWLALAINLAMFGVEIGAGITSGSVSLLADAIDFFGDAANYGVTLAVLSMGALWRTRAAVLKASSLSRPRRTSRGDGQGFLRGVLRGARSL